MKRFQVGAGCDFSLSQSHAVRLPENPKRDAVPLEHIEAELEQFNFSGEMWLYVMTEHKTARKVGTRAIPLGAAEEQEISSKERESPVCLNFPPAPRECAMLKKE